MREPMSSAKKESQSVKEPSPPRRIEEATSGSLSQSKNLVKQRIQPDPVNLMKPSVEPPSKLSQPPNISKGSCASEEDDLALKSIGQISEVNSDDLGDIMQEFDEHEKAKAPAKEEKAPAKKKSVAEAIEEPSRKKEAVAQPVKKKSVSFQPTEKEVSDKPAKRDAIKYPSNDTPAKKKVTYLLPQDAKKDFMNPGDFFKEAAKNISPKEQMINKLVAEVVSKQKLENIAFAQIQDMHKEHKPFDPVE